MTEWLVHVPGEEVSEPDPQTGAAVLAKLELGSPACQISHDRTGNTGRLARDRSTEVQLTIDGKE